MNRRLEINIDEIEKEHQEQGSQSEQEEEQYDESQGEIDEEQEEDSQEFQERDTPTAYETIETFGNQLSRRDAMGDFSTFNQNMQQRLKSHNHNRLPDTPIEEESQTKSVLIKSDREMEKSVIDEEVNRIVIKMSQKEKAATAKFGVHQEIEKAKNIERINKELLSQNSHLITEINELEKKLACLTSKLPKRAAQAQNKDKSVSSCEDKDLQKLMKSYREKLSKASLLNSKLSSRLNTEKSRSQVISNTYRSMIHKGDLNSEEIQVISTIRSNVVKDDLKFSKKSKSKRGESNFTQNINKSAEPICEKCKEVKPAEQLISKRSRDLVFSPVLQFKNYEINHDKQISNEFSLTQKESVRPTKHSECQTANSYFQYLRELDACNREEAELQRIIKANNEKIHAYEESLYKMIDFN